MSSEALKFIFGEARNALSLMKKAPEKLCLAVVVDALFFVVYGFITAPLFSKIVDYVIVIGTTVNENAPDMIRSSSPSISSIILNDAESSMLLTKLMLVFIVLAVSIYIVYTFFQGIAWKLSSGIAGKKNSTYSFMKEFARLNLFWFALFIIYHLMSLFSDLRDSALKSMGEPGFSIGMVLLGMLIVILYFACISYAFIGSKKGGVKNAFRTGISRALYTVPAVAVIAIVYFALTNIIDLISGFDTKLAILFGVFTMLPAMTFARVYLALVVEKAK